jgi:hypothetical protein
MITYKLDAKTAPSLAAGASVQPRVRHLDVRRHRLGDVLVWRGTVGRTQRLADPAQDRPRGRTLAAARRVSARDLPTHHAGEISLHRTVQSARNTGSCELTEVKQHSAGSGVGWVIITHFTSLYVREVGGIEVEILPHRTVRRV